MKKRHDLLAAMAARHRDEGRFQVRVDVLEPTWSRNNGRGAVKLTDLRTYSELWTLHKLLILRSRSDRFRLNPENST